MAIFVLSFFVARVISGMIGWPVTPTMGLTGLQIFIYETETIPSGPFNITRFWYSCTSTTDLRVCLYDSLVETTVPLWCSSPFPCGGLSVLSRSLSGGLVLPAPTSSLYIAIQPESPASVTVGYREGGAGISLYTWVSGSIWTSMPAEADVLFMGKNAQIPAFGVEYDLHGSCTADTCDNSNLVRCNGPPPNATFGSVSNCTFGCAPGSSTCVTSLWEVGSRCSQDVCDPSLNSLWECDLSSLSYVRSTHCNWTCYPGAGSFGMDRCYSEFELGASCVKDRCQGESRVWFCGEVSGELESSLACSWGCDENLGDDRCFDRYEFGAACGADQCENLTSLWRCDGGATNTFFQLDTCWLGCNASISECVDDWLEIGALCRTDHCESDYVAWLCDESTGMINGSTVRCQYGCGEGCYGQFDPGALCSESLCVDENYLSSCGAGLMMEGTHVCPFGCNQAEGYCYDQFEVGSHCESSKCYSENRGEPSLLWLCHEERMGGSLECVTGTICVQEETTDDATCSIVGWRSLAANSPGAIVGYISATSAIFIILLVLEAVVCCCIFRNRIQTEKSVTAVVDVELAEDAPENEEKLTGELPNVLEENPNKESSSSSSSESGE